MGNYAKLCSCTSATSHIFLAQYFIEYMWTQMFFVVAYLVLVVLVRLLCRHAAIVAPPIHEGILVARARLFAHRS